ncbi:CLUMA_CG002010, isoform A [Clunio marinus]|uniref:Anaphase-promoting complex subunit 5 n=1 Tax=Clunio marinus TaxID=568069 RepID=A0A1J1HJM5_9DIPT|nr:CLUMA_CG002010, isoform A [Clunio marinus]
MIVTKESDTNFFLPLPPGKNFDNLSPYKICVAIILQEFWRKHRDREVLDMEIDEKYVVPSVNYPAEYRRKFYMTLLKLIQLPDLSYKDLHIFLTAGKFPLEAWHMEAFQGVMSIVSEVGIEILFKLTKTIDDLITETIVSGANSPCVHQGSVIGLYLRRILLHLEKMPFQDLMNLYQNIITYYEKGIRALEISPATSNLDDIEDTMMTKHKWSSKQAELFVTQQTSFLENDETKALNPKELQKRIDEIVQIYTPLYSKAYFLSYLNNIRIRDLPNCIEALHRSFDRNAGKHGHNHQDQNTCKSNFQYSVLNLAVLHTMFDHNTEALKCLKECIMIAQENGDRVCLQLAQLWLCLLDKSNFQLSEKNIANKTEMSLVRSVSLNIQSLVKVAAISGYLPSKLFDVLIKSDILNCQHSMVNLISNCVAERTALWTLYGKYEIASLSSQLLLNSNLKTMERTHNGEGTCQALCTLAMWMAMQGDFLSSSVILSKAKEKFPRFPISRNWMLVNQYVTSQQAIYHEKWSDASIACDHLYHLDPNLSLLQRANMNIARGNRSDALSLLDRLLSQDDEKLEPLLRVRGLVAQAQSLIDRHNIPSESLLILNRASSFAEEKHLDYEHSIVEMNIAYVLYRMEMHQQALKILKLNMENILANGGIYDKAKLFFLFVQSIIASSPSKNMKLENVKKTSEQIELAINFLTKLECWNKVKDIYMFLAKLYNELNMIEERNFYALKFRLTAEERTNNTNDNINIFH